MNLSWVLGGAKRCDEMPGADIVRSCLHTFRLNEVYGRIYQEQLVSAVFAVCAVCAVY